MTGQRQILLSTDPVPRTSIKLLSLLAHVLGLTLILVMRHSTGPRIILETYVPEPTVPRSAGLVFSHARTNVAPPRAALLHTPKSLRMKPFPMTPPLESAQATESTSLGILRGHAKQATARLLADFKASQISGFSPESYQFPVQISGVLPTILASDLPPRFEQYLTVEVTIDIDGHVANAEVVSGEAMPNIEQRLLSAIREFKYIPAKREGSPIPFQVDLIVHIPS